MDAQLRGALWLVLPSDTFDALVEQGGLDGDTLIVPSSLCEEIADNWAMIQAAFVRAGYDVEEIKCEH